MTLELFFLIFCLNYRRIYLYLSLTPYFVIKSEEELNKGFCDIFLKPLNPYVKYIGLVEFKYIKKSQKLSKEKIKVLVKDATEQLLEYEKDELVTNYLKDGLLMQKVIILFWGWEMVYCEVV